MVLLIVILMEKKLAVRIFIFTVKDMETNGLIHCQIN